MVGRSRPITPGSLCCPVTIGKLDYTVHNLECDQTEVRSEQTVNRTQSSRNGNTNVLRLCQFHSTPSTHRSHNTRQFYTFGRNSRLSFAHSSRGLSVLPEWADVYRLSRLCHDIVTIAFRLSFPNVTGRP